MLEDTAALLALWGIAEREPMRELVPDSVYQIGEQWVLKRVGENTAVSQTFQQFVQNVLHHLQTGGVPVAIPMVDKNGRFPTPHYNNLYALFPFLLSARGSLREDRRRQLFFNYGQMMATMHQSLATYPQRKIPPNLRVNDLDNEVFSIGVPIISAYLNGRYPQIIGLLNTHEQPMREAFTQLPIQLIHRDCHPENFLNNGTTITGIIDWEQLSLGPRLLDVAYFAVQVGKWMATEPQKMSQWQADIDQLLTGYQSQSPLSGVETAVFPYLLITVPVLFAHWFIENGAGHEIQPEIDMLLWLGNQALEKLQAKPFDSAQHRLIADS